MAENVGAAMRAMANFGVRRLRLVNPREPWPNAKAEALSSGAFGVLEPVETFTSLADALKDLNLVFATTARQQDIAKPVVSPAEAGRLMRADIAAGGRVGVVFGRERWGLTTDEVALTDQILTIPVDPAFASLNIAQAVLTVCYEWRQALIGDDTATPFPERQRSPLAPKEQVFRMFEHLEAALDEVEFFRPPEKRGHMVRNLRTIFQKARLTEQEIRTLRGVISALERRPTRPTARRPAASNEGMGDGPAPGSDTAEGA